MIFMPQIFDVAANENVLYKRNELERIFQVEPSKLRYAVGAILSENDAPVDEGLKKKLLEAGYQTFTLPDVSYVVKAAFPYRTSLSIFIAIARVYPKIDEYVKVSPVCVITPPHRLIL